jgi:hypothetical protein
MTISKNMKTSATRRTFRRKRCTRPRVLATAAAAMSCAALTVATPGAHAMPSDCVAIRASIQTLAVGWTYAVAQGLYDVAAAEGQAMQAQILAYRTFGC